ncbi:hypothetical protein JHFBIEKO_4800 [Methylobacterium mesophilicum]|uniref:hypothetical protein n=1 Tax=Methylobacterium mesophilicum TaxID=39956 RepID=UPI001EE3824E|nr:hypothetical protein [Methylobacterium mesophilicum]GJE24328.1 hypothetical protein JHFBIEKO_4800 [Methylobacterium mesophilicum]
MPRALTDRPSRNVGVILDDLTLDAIDLLRLADDEAPSRSKMIRELTQFALALILDPAAADEFVASHLAKDADHATTPLRDAVPAGRA